MLYRVGTKSDLLALPSGVPPTVLSCLSANVSILDHEYGADRNLDRDDGGYCLYAETAYDVHLMYAAVDMDSHPCEWLDLLPCGAFCAAMFLLSNDFAIVCIFPVSLLPAALEPDRWG